MRFCCKHVKKKPLKDLYLISLTVLELCNYNVISLVLAGNGTPPL